LIYAASKIYADELKGKIAYGLEITELSTHLQGRLVATIPRYDLFDAFAPANVHGKPKARQEWAVNN
jgi:hypothetical protein